MIFVKHFKGLSSWGSPGEYFIIFRSLRDAFGHLYCRFWSTALQCGARLPIHTLNFLSLYSVVPVFSLGLCLRGTLPNADLWFTVECRRSVVTRCALFILLYLCRMCHCGLNTVLWSLIAILIRLLASEPRSNAGFLFPSPAVSMWNDLGDSVFDGVGLTRFKTRASASLLAKAAHSIVLYYFLFLFFLSMVSHVGLESSDRSGVRRHSLLALHFRPFLTTVIIIVTGFKPDSGTECSTKLFVYIIYFYFVIQYLYFFNNDI